MYCTFDISSYFPPSVNDIFMTSEKCFRPLQRGTASNLKSSKRTDVSSRQKSDALAINLCHRRTTTILNNGLEHLPEVVAKQATIIRVKPIERERTMRVCVFDVPEYVLP